MVIINDFVLCVTHIGLCLPVPCNTYHICLTLVYPLNHVITYLCGSYLCHIIVFAIFLFIYVWSALLMNHIVVVTVYLFTCCMMLDLIWVESCLHVCLHSTCVMAYISMTCRVVIHPFIYLHSSWPIMCWLPYSYLSYTLSCHILWVVIYFELSYMLHAISVSVRLSCILYPWVFTPYYFIYLLLWVIDCLVLNHPCLSFPNHTFPIPDLESPDFSDHYPIFFKWFCQLWLTVTCSHHCVFPWVSSLRLNFVICRLATTCALIVTYVRSFYQNFLFRTH